MNKKTMAQPNGAISLEDRAAAIRSREEFVAFVRALVSRFREVPGEWENNELPSYLDALAAWVEDMDGYYKNRGEALPDPPGWNTLAQMLLAARVYE
jgi:hypothetical protein